MIAYLDSSVLLQNVLQGDIALYHALEFENVFSSELLQIECNRVLQRLRLINQIDEIQYIKAIQYIKEIITGINIIPLKIMYQI